MLQSNNQRCPNYHSLSTKENERWKKNGCYFDACGYPMAYDLVYELDYELVSELDNELDYKLVSVLDHELVSE